MDGKGMVGKGMVGKAMVRKAMVGKAMVGKAMAGKGSRRRDWKINSSIRDPRGTIPSALANGEYGPCCIVIISCL